MSLNLSIKGVPEEWAQRLRERAARNHRSLQGELMALLGEAVGDAAAVAAPVARAGARPAAGALSIDEAARRARGRFGGDGAAFGRSVDIVRALRDEGHAG